MIMHVRNFGKIESADINLSSLVVFVGENNSGKSYLMQLIYGLFSYIQEDILSDLDVKALIVEGGVRKKNHIIIKVKDTNFYENLQSAINKCIEKNKSAIIEKTFHAEGLTIDSLTVEFTPLRPKFSVIYEGDKEDNKDLIKSYAIRKNSKLLYKMNFTGDVSEEIIQIATAKEVIKILLLELMGVKFDRSKAHSNEKSFVYLPSTRAGMMMLYADYLVDSKKNKDYYKKYELTEPVYNFLTNLLDYEYSEKVVERNKEIITFLENNILKGHLEKAGNNMFYTPKNSEQAIPMQLASSMVTEMTPIYQLLTDVKECKYLLYDGVEEGLYPDTQQEVVRLIMRMVNSGYRVIISTHSDTIAAILNNFVVLAYKFAKTKEDIMQKLNYEHKDVLENPYMTHVGGYEFIIGEDGKTKVEEMEGHFSIGIGFEFALFNKFFTKLYDDTTILYEKD